MNFNSTKIKAVLSSILIVLFLIVGITGIVLYFGPSGSAARDWSFFGFDRPSLRFLHNYCGIAMVCLKVLHISLNLKVFWCEVKALFKIQKKCET